MTVKEVASLLGVDLSTLYRWDKQGVLKRQRIGGKVVYRASDVEEIVKSRKS
jgi:excisionase family DNA binding protein